MKFEYAFGRLLAVVGAAVAVSGCATSFVPDPATTSPILTGDEAWRVCHELDRSVNSQWVGIATNHGTPDEPDWVCSGTNGLHSDVSIPQFEEFDFEGFNLGR